MNLIDKDTTPRSTPAIPVQPRMSPCTVMVCTSDANRRVADAIRNLTKLQARMSDGQDRDDVLSALADLSIAAKSHEAVMTECAKAVR